MELVRKINEKIIKALSLILILFGTVLTITVFVNVCSRYFFHTTIPWAEELARFIFIWVTFIGVVVANDKSEHMRLDFLVAALPGKAHKTVEIIAYIISVALLCLLIHGGTRYTLSQWDWKSSALGVRHGLVYSIAPICMSYMLLQFLAKAIVVVQSFGKKGDVE
ncbi:TRAP transporter small permease [Chakrabartyella piscis]|uniref:TRAP transporter small permease n=1 Tax=Chakrabartyella piscis TaxID=2918914 RepID=UPI00295847F6|nr:TRAP transporter small permease [Chakrabartyella piscis]